MTNYDLSIFKEKQDEFAKRTEGFIQSVEPFRNGLIENIRHFFKEAKDIGLLNNKKLMKIDKHKETTHYLFLINRFELVLVSTNNVADLLVRKGMKFRSSKYFVESIEKIPLSALASMIFLYREGTNSLVNG